MIQNTFVNSVTISSQETILFIQWAVFRFGWGDFHLKIIANRITDKISVIAPR